MPVRFLRTAPRLIVLLLFFSSMACGPDASTRDALFARRSPTETGIDFENRLNVSEDFNVFTFRNYYNGGGVGIGDLNGDGLADIYFTANQQPNRLYLNRGGFQFEDVSEAAGVGGSRGWSTGVSLADVNGDGLLDIYVCNSGKQDGAERANELFINRGTGPDGIPVFEEQVERYGLGDEGYTTHAAFFDYDRDGDLDAYVLNNSFRPAGSFGQRNIRHIRDDRGGDKLYRNDGGRFVDVSEEAGIFGSEIGFGLGVTVGDLNRDGWQDIYVSNDFFERDYLYVNEGDGTFRESLVERMRHVSLSSMGADMADINNDALPEIYVTDMLPESERRLKTTTTFRSWDVYQTQLRNDYYHQVMRNTLHLNNADETFSDIGHIAGVASTDWSWGALFADFDLDGYKDIFVANGIFKDLTNQDFIDYLGSDATITQWLGSDDKTYLGLLDQIPSEPVPNYMFRNEGDLRFRNVAEEWNLATPSFSNGAAYGDLDNDGDLDLVVNNVNMPSFVYESLLVHDGRPAYLQFVLSGAGMNTLGVGAAVVVHVNGEQRYLEQIPQRGFQSSVDPVLTFGLGSSAVVDSVVVTWPDGRRQVLQDVEPSTRVTLSWDEAQPAGASSEASTSGTRLFSDVTAEVGLPYRHEENDFSDFDRESLLIRMLSTEGPAMAVGDVNGDALDDLFLGGARDRPGSLLLQRPDGSYRSTKPGVLSEDRASEDVAAIFFDADGDGDEDLYVVSGGSEFTARSPELQDRLYLNDGAGRLTRSSGLPTFTESGSVVAAADYDSDGDLDLFVGGRLVPGQYGLDPGSLILRNDGTGAFSDVTNFAAPALTRIGLVTDAVWTDVNQDSRTDLIVVGEWMPVTVFTNDGSGRLVDVTHSAGLDHFNGLWNSVIAYDADQDGDVDIVAGNLGLNTKLRATPAEPMTMYTSDFDRNGSVEQIVFYHSGGGAYPVALRGELVRQLTFLKKRYVSYADFAEQEATDIFTEDELATAVKRTVHTLESSLFLNNGAGFERRSLPFEAQLSPVYSLLTGDFDDDGKTDLMGAGNLFEVRPSIGRMDASYGMLLRGTKDRTYVPVPSGSSGFRVDGQARVILPARNARLGTVVVVARNNEPVQIFRATRWNP